jgi:riboflavin synthase alpha subunit
MRTRYLVTAVVGGAAVVAGAGWGLYDGVSAPAAAAADASMTNASFTAASNGDGGGHVRGTVTAENGSNWTVTTAKGQAVTVTISPQTQFGTAKKKETAAQFPVGTKVAVAGTRSDPTHLAATRVAEPRKGHGVRGKVTAENGSSWTVTTAKGKAVTVAITPQTQFGTKKQPATAAQFPVGAEVRVVGDGAQKGKDGGSLTAARIVAPKKAPANGTS